MEYRSQPFRVLIVDDQALDMVQLNFLSKGLGFDVTLAFDGDQALELARRKPYDLIILDWHMPEMPGWAFLKNLERGQLENNIVLHTSEDLRKEDFTEETCFRILDVWQKPLDPSTYMKNMNRIREKIGA